jgi:hypothetical protein
MSVNAWLFLNEDEPANSGYSSGDSCFQRLIGKRVYDAVDTLFIAFVNVVPTSPTTIPVGDSSTFTLANGDVSHPGGLNNADYMAYIVRDARKTNPNIRFLTTLNWGEGDMLSKIFAKAKTPPERAAAAKAFAGNMLAFLRHWGLSGFDIDWESPLSDDTSEADLTLLLNVIGTAFRAQNPPLLLTLSPVTAENLDAGAVNKNVAFLNLQLYGGTSPDEYTGIGIDASLLAYGAKFESNYQDAEQAYQGAVAGHYATITQWRLNSSNFVYEQDQQRRLYQLAHSN